MRAMILAAGRGERMRPLTDAQPKPLLPVAGKPLIVWHIERLVACGITEIIINHAWLGHLIEKRLGNGSEWGAQLHYSAEGSCALETAGGIAKALPLLGDAPFLVMNGDIWCNYDLNHLSTPHTLLNDSDALAWLLLVPNPEHHPQGDFCLQERQVSVLPHTASDQDTSYTFSGIGLYKPALFDGVPRGGRAALGPLLRQQALEQRLIGDLHHGTWVDVGTPERLHYVENLVSNWPTPEAHVTLNG